MSIPYKHEEETRVIHRYKKNNNNTVYGQNNIYTLYVINTRKSRIKIKVVKTINIYFKTTFSWIQGRISLELHDY